MSGRSKFKSLGFVAFFKGKTIGISSEKERRRPVKRGSSRKRAQASERGERDVENSNSKQSPAFQIAARRLRSNESLFPFPTLVQALDFSGKPAPCRNRSTRQRARNGAKSVSSRGARSVGVRKSESQRCAKGIRREEAKVKINEMGG